MFRFAAALYAALVAAAAPAMSAESTDPPHVVYGIVVRVAPAAIVIRRHDGRLATIDIAPAQAAGTTGVLYVDRPVAIYGDLDRAGRYHAESIRSWYGLRRNVWPADR